MRVLTPVVEVTTLPVFHPGLRLGDVSTSILGDEDEDTLIVRLSWKAERMQWGAER